MIQIIMNMCSVYIVHVMSEYDTAIMSLSHAHVGFIWDQGHFASHVLLPLIKMCSKHDDVIQWKHFPHYWPFVRGIHRSPVNYPHKGQWRGALLFSLICASTYGWVNNRDAGTLRRNHAHYDVRVMGSITFISVIVPTRRWKVTVSINTISCGWFDINKQPRLSNVMLINHWVNFMDWCVGIMSISNIYSPTMMCYRYNHPSNILADKERSESTVFILLWWSISYHNLCYQSITIILTYWEQHQ